MFRDKDVPMDGYYVATPGDGVLTHLFGGEALEGVCFTRDQLKHLKSLYGYEDTIDKELVDDARVKHASNHIAAVADWHKKHPRPTSWDGKPPELEPFNEKDITTFVKAGGQLGMLRRAQRDGLRVMAFLAKYCQGEDPVKVVARLASDAGYDVDPGIMDWVEEVPEDDPEP